MENLKKAQTNAAREENALLSFLKQTREGKYAKIDEDSLEYARVKEERGHIDSFTETYYYSLS